MQVGDRDLLFSVLFSYPVSRVSACPHKPCAACLPASLPLRQSTTRNAIVLLPRDLEAAQHDLQLSERTLGRARPARHGRTRQASSRAYFRPSPPPPPPYIYTDKTAVLIEVFKLVPFRPRLKATIFVCKSFHGLIFEKSLWSSVETDRALVGPTLAYMIQPGCASAEPLLPRGSVDGVAVNMAYVGFFLHSFIQTGGLTTSARAQSARRATCSQSSSG